MLLLKNARVVDYLSGIDEKRDILVSAGDILSVSGKVKVLPDLVENIIDCSGLVAIPGIFDMHVHARDPGQTHKEDLKSCSEAAIAGGVTGFLCMPNTEPVTDNEQTLKYISEKAKTCKAKIYAACSITEGQEGEKICDFGALKEAGAVAATDDGKPVRSARVMGEAMIQAGDVKMPIISHCEDLDIAHGGLINAGKVSIIFGVWGMHRTSENIITSREIDLARDLYEKVHIAHVSTKEA